MSHRRDMKRAAAGGYPAPEDSTGVDSLAELRLAAAVAKSRLDRVQSLLRTWEQFGIGDEDTVISELATALGQAGGR